MDQVIYLMEHQSGFGSVAFSKRRCDIARVWERGSLCRSILLRQSCFVTIAADNVGRSQRRFDRRSSVLGDHLERRAKQFVGASTRRKHLSAPDLLYEAAHRQRGSDCLDRLIAEADALEDVLLGFLAQLHNETITAGNDKSSTWTSAVGFVIAMLRYAGNSSGARAAEMEAKLLFIASLPPVRRLPKGQ